MHMNEMCVICIYNTILELLEASGCHRSLSTAHEFIRKSPDHHHDLVVGASRCSVLPQHPLYHIWSDSPQTSPEESRPPNNFSNMEKPNTHKELSQNDYIKIGNLK